MGNLTTAYSIPVELFNYLARGCLTTEQAFQFKPDGSVVWRNTVFFTFDEEKPVDVFRFDKAFEDVMRAFEVCGFRSAATRLQTGKYISSRNDETGFREGWTVLPSAVKAAAASLEKLPDGGLPKKWEAARKKQLKESGLDIRSFDDLLIPDVEHLKMFLAKAAAEGNKLAILVA